MVLLALLVGLPVSVSAQPYDWPPDEFEDDPLGLIASYGTTSYYTNLEDRIEVWICQPDGHTGVVNQTVQQLTDRLNKSILPGFFRSLSGGRYTLRFVPGGTTTAFDWRWCEPAEQRDINTAGLMAVAGDRLEDQLEDLLGGGADLPTGGGRQPLPPWVFNTYPSNKRRIIAGFYNGLEGMNIAGIRWVLSRTLAWGRSFTRALPESAIGYERDNPMDMLGSGGALDNLVGTIAVNLYAAGWIDPSDVHIYQGGTDQVTLSVGWEPGTQMIVLPSEQRGHFLSLGARAAQRHDREIPKEGVESYIVSHHECDLLQMIGGTPNPCWGTQRTHKPWPHDTETKTDALGFTVLRNPLMHVLGVGQSLEWNGITVSVADRTGDQWTVTITDGTEPIPDLDIEQFDDGFVDDDGNTHEQAINRIADAGITVGCADEPEPLFCPDRAVTRAEMAAFMLRATGRGDVAPARSNTFSDVPEGEWFTDYVHAFAETGIDTGRDGEWRPDDALTRLEMAYWLTGVFDHIVPISTAVNPLGQTVSRALGLFEDVDQADWTVVEGLYRVGVTYGCSDDPLLYCPDASVTRGQMASFITRALRD